MAFMKKTRLYLIDIDLHYLEQTFQYLSATAWRFCAYCAPFPVSRL